MKARRYSKFLAGLRTSLILLSLLVNSAMAAGGDTIRVSVAAESTQPSIITERVSIAPDGTQGNDDSGVYWGYISGNGRYVAFGSLATNLVLNDTNNTSDVFVRDLFTNQTVRASIASDGTQGNDWSTNAVAISADGRYVAFSSYATNLVPNDTNGIQDVFLHDMQSGQTQRVSIASDGTQANSISGQSQVPVSSDGRYIAFQSYASNLVSNDMNGEADVFVHDRLTGRTQIVSVATDGTRGNGWSDIDGISSDGRYIGFFSSATNLVAGDTNGMGDAFIHDMQTGQTSRVSISSDGSQANGSSGDTYPSADGRYILFYSSATNLVPGDTNGKGDLFVHDVQTGQTSRVSISSDGSQANDHSYYASISQNGRNVVFSSNATNLIAGDTNGVWDVFVHDRNTAKTFRVSVASDGAQANGVSGGTIRRPTISDDGTLVVYASDASNLVPGDTNGYMDVFVTRIIQSFGISGRVVNSSSNVISGVSISDGAGHTTTTDSSGNYTLSGLEAGTYTITPSKSGYTFSPPSRAVTVPPDATGQDFTAQVITYSIISGHVMDGSSNGIAGVSVSDGAGHTAITNSNGNYILSGLAAGTYTVTPSKSGYTFSPASRVVTVPPNGIDQDFTGIHQPVIFIPGIMGSNLYDDNGNLHWLSAANVLPPSYWPLFLDSNGLSPNPTCLFLLGAATCNQNAHSGSAGMVLRAPVFNDSVYADLVAHFRAQGYTEGSDTTPGDFWVFNYDWRKNIIPAADNLDAYIDTILSKTQTNQVVIVAHSMGGLVARQYISNQDRARKVSQLITLGTPYLGTPQAFAVLQGLACVKDLGLFGCLPDSSTASALAHNFPAFHELLPSRAYFTAKGSGYYANNPTDDPAGYCPQCLSYEQTYQTNIASNINPPLLTSADTFHQNLDNNTNWNNVPLTVIYGTYQNTIAGIQKVDMFSWSSLTNTSIAKPVVTLNGDGTVTTLSATMSGLGVNATYLPFSDDHGGLVIHPLVLDHVDSALGLPPLSATMLAPQEINSDPTGAEIVAIGVKAIDVTDSAGNHTGPQVGSNIIDESIPGSVYFSQDDLAMVALLGGQSYTITVTPSGFGPVDISLVRMTPSGTSATQLYTGIPTSAQSRIRLTGDPYQVNTWQFDVDGSGNQVQTVDPTLSYTGTNPVDYTPPQASIQIQGTVGPNGWYTVSVTVTLSATDNAGGSGVNRIEYAFGNDHAPQLYTGPFIADPNRVSMLYVIATDQAGNQQTIPTTARIGPEKIYLPLMRR